MDAKAFAESASPGMWLQVAVELFDTAVEMRKPGARSLIGQRVDGGPWYQKDGANRTLFLLSGFAMENALKAFLVYENPAWVSNGRLARPLKSHSLTELRERSALAPHRKRLAWVLSAMEDGLESWARYPCSLKMETIRSERFMTDAIWAGYLKIMSEYGAKLTKLIARKPWKGPHGVGGAWSFHGEYLGALVDIEAKQPAHSKRKKAPAKRAAIGKQG